MTAPAPVGAPLSIPSLDGIRALSFAIVFIGHAGFGDVFPGGFGVTVFFFLSGYLITTLLRREVEGSSGVAFRKFYARRALRILPTYYVVLLLSMVGVWIGVIGGGVELGPALSQLFYLNNYWQIANGISGQPAGTEVYWSLAVEEHFYFVFPVVFLGLMTMVRTTQARALALLGACALVLAWRFILVLQLDATVERTYYATDTRIDSILFGAVLAVHRNPAIDEPRSDTWLRRTVPVALVLLAVSVAVRSDVFRETIRYSIQGLALIPLFVLAVAHPSAPVVRWLNVGWMRWAGRLSYAAYLVHLVVLLALGDHLEAPKVVIAVLGLVITFALAEGLHRTVERPLAKVRARYR